MFRRACVVLSVAWLVACSQPASAPTEADQALLRTIEEPQQRAKAVEADVLRAQQRVDEALNAQDTRDEPADE